MLEINEIFGPTIQGEGKKVGTPSVFIRFGKCNMQCEGFNVEYETPSGIKKLSCDSYYAADKAFKHTWQSYKNHQEIIQEVARILPAYKCDIVITGGEPLLYWNNDEFQKLLEYYVHEGFPLTIETNASLNITLKHDYQKAILFSMSVKLSNSKEPLKKRINIDTLTTVCTHAKEHYLKFVIDKTFLNHAIEEIQAILDKIPPTEVFLMPMGDSAKQIDENSEAVINMAIQHGFKYSDRLHIRVWDNKRGV